MRNKTIGAKCDLIGNLAKTMRYQPRVRHLQHPTSMLIIALLELQKASLV